MSEIFEEIFKTILCLIFLIFCLIDSFWEIVKILIKNANEYFWGIVFFIWSVISIKKFIHNCRIKKKYKRDNNKYKIKRNVLEGGAKERHTIYLVSKEKNSEGKFMYHHIVNMYTVVKLGYTRPSREGIEDNFSAEYENYKMGKNIIIYNITFDFKKIDG